MGRKREMKRILKGIGLTLGALLIVGILMNVFGKTTVDKTPVNTENSNHEAFKEEPDNATVEASGNSDAEDPLKAEREYAENVERIMNTSAETMKDFAVLFKQSSEDTSLMSDEGWKLNIIDIYFQLEDQREELVNLDVPPSFQASHELTVGAYDSFLQSKDLLFEGIDSLDSDLIMDGVSYISEGHEKLKIANESLKRDVEENINNQ